MDKWIELEDHYSVQETLTFPIVITKGKGSWVWDDKKNRYLDLLGGRSGLGFGHCHPKLLKALSLQSQQLTVADRSIYNDKQGLFLKQLCQLTGMDRALATSSGSDAVEAAIKGARQWGYHYKAIPLGKAEIIVADDNYHGNTLTLLGLSSNEAERQGFGPFAPGFKRIPFGSAEALEFAISSNTCAFLVEPLQTQAGIKIPPKGWLKKVEKICKKHEVLLILDEIQTGLCRTGKTFAFQHENVLPDGLILGKSLGGGLIPSACFLGKKELMEWFEPTQHPSSHGGNCLAAAVGMEILKLVREEKLAARSKTLGDYFLKKLQTIDSPYVSNIRGKGLWIGIDINPKKTLATHVCEKLLERGVLAKECHEMTVQLMPPLTITKAEIDWAVLRFNEVLESSLLPSRKRRERTQNRLRIAS
ncbi:MAG TPA: ornithine--oxo-acid transaminase [Rhabdochlamydiaceae bacterium]|nr:ornithine--oxo-acid transaminase [Rhabdochlamydiaceae bacterium]